MSNIFLDSFDYSKPLSLYIHVPFCTRKCSYCAFYSKSLCNKTELESYTDKIVSEIRTVVSLMDRPFHTAFIGGGNPGLLSDLQLERITSAVCEKGRPLEFTTEMNPESLRPSLFPLFDRYLTRLSMGVQSLDGKALSFLGRNATKETTLKGIGNALELREKTGAHISFDMITCLGNFHDALDDVRRMVESYSPEHLSVYALTLEEGTELEKRNPILPDSEEQYDVLMPIWDYLKSNGYNHYEVSNFAKDGFESLHNSVYWSYRQYMGLGPSAASTAFKGGLAKRFVFPDDVLGFVSSPLFSGFETEELTKTEELEEFVLMGMRHLKGLDLERLRSDFGLELERVPSGYQKKGSFLVPDENGLMTGDSAAFQVLEMLGLPC